MRVEAECVSFKGLKGEKVSTASYSIPSANWVGIDFLGNGTKVAVFCSADNKTGSVLINDPGEAVGAYKFKSLDDQEGEKVNISERIEIEGEQQLLIYARKGKLEKEILIFLNSENKQNQETDPQDNSKENALEILPFAS